MKGKMVASSRMFSVRSSKNCMSMRFASSGFAAIIWSSWSRPSVSSWSERSYGIPRKLPVSSVCPMSSVGLVVSVWICRSCCGLSSAVAVVLERLSMSSIRSVDCILLCFIKCAIEIWCYKA